MVTPRHSLSKWSLPFTTPSWHCQVCRAIQFPHKVNTFTTCMQRARWTPRATWVSMAGFQLILESTPTHSHTSACSALILPPKPKISLCCADATGNTRLLVVQQKYKGENRLQFSWRCHMILAASSFRHTTLTPLQGRMFGCHKRVVTQNSSFNQIVAFTSGIYETMFDWWPPLLLRCTTTTFRVINKFRGWYQGWSSAFWL